MFDCLIAWLFVVGVAAAAVVVVVYVVDGVVVIDVVGLSRC